RRVAGASEDGRGARRRPLACAPRGLALLARVRAPPRREAGGAPEFPGRARGARRGAPARLGGRAATAVPSVATRRPEYAGRACERDARPLRAGRPRAASPLPPREARDR